MAEIKLHRKLIYAGDAHRAILEADPKLAYCIERIKAVDAVEVVRCKDCKHFIPYVNECYEEHNHYTEEGYREVSENDFCSYGERKDNG